MSLLSALLIIDVGCGTRAGNPHKPKTGGGEETKKDPVEIPEIQTVSLTTDSTTTVSELSETQQTIFVIANNSYVQAEIMSKSLSDLNNLVRGQELFLDEKATFKINQTDVEGYVTKTDEIYTATFCVAGKPFYEIKWNEEETKFWTKRDIDATPEASDADKSLGTKYFINIDITYDAQKWPTFSTRFKGKPAKADYFIANRNWIMQSSVAIFTENKEAFYRHAVRWAENENDEFSDPYLIASGQYTADKIDNVLAYHAEVPILCRGKTFDETNLDSPGWCLGFKTDHSLEPPKRTYIIKSTGDVLWQTFKEKSGIMKAQDVVAPGGFDRTGCSP